MFLTHALRAIYRTVVATTDPFFKYVSLLLTGNSPVDTFVTDASTNNFAVSIVGDTKPNNFNPFTPGRFSNFFDGSGDYLSVADNAAFEVGSGDFTLEGWFYGTAASAGDNLIVAKCSAAYAPYWVSFNAGNSIQFCASSANSGWDVANNVPFGSPTLNSWNHFAVSRSGSSIRLFLNGVLGATVTSSSPLTDHASPFTVGSQFNGANPFTGFISNVRLVKGTAVYTAAFTPSTTPLTAIANTSLLTCQSTRLIDASANAFTITANGDVASRTFNPFIPDPTASTYGSAFFDGTGDYLTVPTTTALSFGTGDFTVECWAYKTVAANASIIDSRVNPGSATPWALYVDVSNFPYFYDGTVYTSSVAIALNTWVHIAVIRTSGALRIFVNGVQGLSVPNSTNLDRSAGAFIGMVANTVSPTAYWLGFISNLRIVKGTAVYTAAFTPPTAPLTAITNTSLLTLQTNQAINNNLFIDDSTNNFAVTRVGNTTQGTFSPYGANWSNYFDGTGDYLGLPANVNLTLNGDFTIEVWIYLTALTGSQTVFANSGGNERTLQLNGSGTNWIYWDGSADRTLGLPTVNLWMHIALSRSGSTVKGFLNGVQGFSVSDSGTIDFSSGAIGYRQLFPSGTSINGYMSDFRIVKGTAVYTANFTPPTAPLTAITNTSLLTCQSNRFRDASTNNFAVTKNGDVSVQRFSPFSPSAAYSLSTIGGSAYFDGSDNLSISNSSNFNLVSDFTIECWSYASSVVSGEAPMFGKRASNLVYSQIIFGLNVSGGVNKLFLIGTTSSGSWNIAFTNGSITLPVGQWNHIAIVRSGTTLKTYVNGVADSTWTGVSGAFFTNTDAMTIGVSTTNGTGGYYTGYISNFRFVNGTALYTAAFTPPTAPLTATSNTQLLLNFTDAGVVDNAMMNNLETVGDARVSRAVTKFGSGAMYFDGTGDGLVSVGTPNTAFGTGDFTVELWVNLAANMPNFAKLIHLGTTTNSFSLETQSTTNVLNVTNYTTTVLLTSSTALTTGAWIHVAVCRAAGTLRIFQNGIQTATTGSSIDFGNGGLVYVGQGASGVGINGYIDDLRVTKGYGRYTANFTPPTAALPTS
jgi:hypothetical protein